MYDVNIIDELDFEAGAIYIMDRAYLDYARLYRITKASAFFVTRTKKNTQCRRIFSHDVNRATSVIADQTIILTLSTFEKTPIFQLFCDLDVSKKRTVRLTS
jgi:hypothetical protein